jgi:LytS/YehU family sensor histidine kinase
MKREYTQIEAILIGTVVGGITGYLFMFSLGLVVLSVIISLPLAGFLAVYLSNTPEKKSKFFSSFPGAILGLIFMLISLFGFGDNPFSLGITTGIILMLLLGVFYAAFGGFFSAIGGIIGEKI